MTHYFESGFFVREKAWHGLGKLVHEAPTTREAIRLAGLDWPVSLRPIYANVGDDCAPAEMADHRALCRTVTMPGSGRPQMEALAVVGNRYRAYQNADAFAWFDPLCAEGDCKLEAAGSLMGGRKVWILARISGQPEQVGTKVGDLAVPYLLLSTSHDGSAATAVAFTPIRVVCWNTLSAAMQSATADRMKKVRHTASQHRTLADLRETVNLAKANFTAKAILWREMGQKRWTDMDLQNFCRTVLGDQTMDLADRKATPVRAERLVRDLFYGGPGSDSAGQTPLGGYMAVTHWLDHQRARSAETALASTWFGAGEDVRDRAETVAMSMAGIGAP